MIGQERHRLTRRNRPCYCQCDPSLADDARKPARGLDRMHPRLPARSIRGPGKAGNLKKGPGTLQAASALRHTVMVVRPRAAERAPSCGENKRAVDSDTTGQDHPVLAQARHGNPCHGTGCTLCHDTGCTLCDYDDSSSGLEGPGPLPDDNGPRA